MDPLEPAAQGPRILPRCRPADASRAGLARPRVQALAGPPFVIAEERCNRCGACLRLDCGAIADVGGDALIVDPEACSGCGLCVPVCRAKALAPVEAGAAPRAR